MVRLSHNCCINGNCSYSFDNLATDLSNNSVTNITCDIELSSVITIVSLANITITGNNNPTVGCNDSGGFHCLSCHGVKIQGITWDRCGSENRSNFANPVIKMDKSSAITIQHWIFQHSIGQSIVNNTQYSGHGTVIYYLSESSISSSAKLVLSNSNFKGNKGVKSIIYLNSFKENQYFSLRLLKIET